MRRNARAALPGAALALCVLSCALLAGCALPPGERIGGSRAAAADWGAAHGFRPEEIVAGRFRLFALRRQRQASPLLTVYLEGDGAPWPSLFQPPPDPTPVRPLALLLAGRDDAPAVAYLGRPCQYPDPARHSPCDPVYWSERRFAEEAVHALDLALDRLKKESGAQRLRLIGHSGGGVMAVLLGQRRSDVELIVTLAAPLSLSAWTRRQNLSPLAGSLDPMTLPAGKAWARAVHFAGAGDDVVPAAVIAGFVEVHGGRLESVPGYDHDCCWARDWPNLLARALEGEAAR